MKPTILLLSVCSMLWGCDPGPGSPGAGAVPADRVEDPRAIASGRGLFARNCAVCHGEDATGRGRRAAVLASRPTDFTSASWQRAQTPEGLFEAIREGRPGTDMPSWKALEESEIRDLVAYLRSLGPENSR